EPHRLAGAVDEAVAGNRDGEVRGVRRGRRRRGKGNEGKGCRENAPHLVELSVRVDVHHRNGGQGRRVTMARMSDAWRERKDGPIPRILASSSTFVGRSAAIARRVAS